MKRQACSLFAAAMLFSLAGCPTFESGEVRDIRVFWDGTAIDGLTIQQGQAVSLSVDVGVDPDFVSIVWSVDDSSVAEITGTANGAVSTVRGRSVDATKITVSAWRTHGEPATLTLPVTVVDPIVTSIDLVGHARVGVGERRALVTKVAPAWASQGLEWEATPYGRVELEESGDVWHVRGITAGHATLAATTACGFSHVFEFEVRTPDPITGIDIYMDGRRLSGGTIDLDLFQEAGLTAVVSPPGAYVFLEWFSSDSANVTVNVNGMISGRTANSTATITARANDMAEASVTVNVKNPVTGIRIAYDNDAEQLQVLNTIWLFRAENGTSDYAELVVQLYPEDIHLADATTKITWSVDGGRGSELNLTVAPDGMTATVTGLMASPFGAPPITILVYAENADNLGEPVIARVQVKVLDEEPLWAWDRARDSDINSELLLRETHPVIAPFLPEPWPTLNVGANLGNDWRLRGRGLYGGNQMINAALANHISYAPSGIILNSSNRAGGNNPFPAPAPQNSTRIMIGSNSNVSTVSPNPASTIEGFLEHAPGVFNFIEVNRPIRISVDYEVLWTAGPGRNMWIMINNNQVNAMGSPLMGSLSQVLVWPLTDPRGTRVTAVTTINIPDWIESEVTGWQTLERSFINILALSNGGSISVSGIRVEVGAVIGEGEGGE